MLWRLLPRWDWPTRGQALWPAWPPLRALAGGVGSTVSASPRALYGAKAKLAWGIKHIQTFKAERDRLLGLLDGPAIVFDQKLDGQTNDWVVTVAEVAEFPSLSLLVGDAATTFERPLTT
jgi:hypothetical protein